MPKLTALGDLTTVLGMTVVFNPEKVVAVYYVPQISGPSSGNAGDAGPPASHVYGITPAGPEITQEMPDDFLAKLGIGDRFFIATTIYGPIQIRASAVSWLKSEYAGEDDQRLKCFLSPGPNEKIPWGLTEDVATVRKRVDDIRLQPELDP